VPHHLNTEYVWDDAVEAFIPEDPPTDTDSWESSPSDADNPDIGETVIKCLRCPSKDGLQCCHWCDKLVCKRCIARYKATGDPVCIPCFERVFRGTW